MEKLLVFWDNNLYFGFWRQIEKKEIRLPQPKELLHGNGIMFMKQWLLSGIL